MQLAMMYVYIHCVVKSPISRNATKEPEKREKSPGCTTNDRSHALIEGLSLTGAPLRDMEVETTPFLASNGATSGTEESTKQSCDMPGGSSLPQDVALPQARSSLVWGLLESLSVGTKTLTLPPPKGKRAKPAKDEGRTEMSRPRRRRLQIAFVHERWLARR